MPEGRRNFTAPETVPEGERTSTLIKLIGSLKAKGLENEAIQAAVRIENEKKCVPPLTDQELEKTVFPALFRGWKATAPYDISQQKNRNLDMVAMESVAEEVPKWLVNKYIPKYQITTLAGAGGSGKTTVWCALAAAVSSGKTIFLEGSAANEWIERKPERVMFFRLRILLSTH